MVLTQGPSARPGLVLQRPKFRALLGGYLLHSIGSSATTIALVFAMLGTTHGAPGAGVVLASRAVPALLLGLFGGVAADRWTRRKVVMATSTALAICQVMATTIIVAGSRSLLLIALVASMIGIAEAIGSPALYNILVDVMPKEQIQTSQATIRATRNATSIVSPLVVGVVVAQHGSEWVTAFSAAAAIGSVGLFSALPNVARQEGPESKVAVAQQLLEGWSEFKARPWVVYSVAGFGLALLGWSGSYAILGPMRIASDGAWAETWGFIASALAIGYLLGSLVALRIRPRRPAAWALVAQSATALFPIAIVANLPIPWLLAAAIVSGISMEQSGVMWASALQEFIPRDVVGRVSSFDYVTSFGLVPVGYAVAAPLAQSMGIGATAAVAAALIAAPTLIAATNRNVRSIKRME